MMPYSGNFGISEFPLRTDLPHWVVPPRFVDAAEYYTPAPEDEYHGFDDDNNEF
jgi:hypothetical protein